MWSKKDIIVFFAGAAALNTLSHLLIHFTAVLPITFWGITYTQQLNLYATAISAVITVALLWWASRVK